MTNIEYVDTYGKNLEKALKDYHDEHGEYPEDYTTLVVEELDKEVSCDVTINYGGKVYMTNCKVNNEIVLDIENNIYNYGKYVPAYVIGDVIQFAGSNWYVIDNSNTMKNYVTLLKEKALTKAELGDYRNNTVFNTTEYYWSDECHNSNHGYSSSVTTGCSGHNDYGGSKVKEFLEQTYINTLGEDNLKEVDGYKIRLIKAEDLMSNLGWNSGKGTSAKTEGNNVPSWVYENFGEGTGNIVSYWMMTPNSQNDINCVVFRGGSSFCKSNYYNILANGVAVRPVINLYKDSIGNT